MKAKIKSIKQWNKEVQEYQLKHQGFTGTVYAKYHGRWRRVIYKDLKRIFPPQK